MNKKHMDFDIFLNESLKDPEIKQEFAALEEEFAIAQMVIEKRMEKKLSQKELADRVGTKQSAISRLESGNYNPSLNFLKKVADALDTKLKIEL